MDGYDTSSCGLEGRLKSVFPFDLAWVAGVDVVECAILCAIVLVDRMRRLLE